MRSTIELKFAIDIRGKFSRKTLPAAAAVTALWSDWAVADSQRRRKHPINVAWLRRRYLFQLNRTAASIDGDRIIVALIEGKVRLLVDARPMLCSAIIRN